MYRLCQIFHCRPSELDEESAADCDWILAIDAELKGIEARQAERQSK